MSTLWIIGLNTAIIIISIIGIAVDPASKYSTLKLVEIQCAHLQQKYQSLWLDIESDLINEEIILDKLKQLTQEGNLISDAITMAGIKFDYKLNNKYTDEADKYLTQLYSEEDR